MCGTAEARPCLAWLGCACLGCADWAQGLDRVTWALLGTSSPTRPPACHAACPASRLVASPQLGCVAVVAPSARRRNLGAGFDLAELHMKAVAQVGAAAGMDVCMLCACYLRTRCAGQVCARHGCIGLLPAAFRGRALHPLCPVCGLPDEPPNVPSPMYRAVRVL